MVVEGLRLMTAGKPPAHEELDMAKCDPDRVTPENFDYDDPEMVEGYLDHPSTIAMHEQLGRQFRASTPQEQIPVIEKMFATDRNYLAQLQEVIRREDPPRSDIRWQFVEKLNESVSLAKRRLDELRAEIAED